MGKRVLQQQLKRQQQTMQVILAALGLVLIAAGMVVFLMLGAGGGSQASVVQSTVPAEVNYPAPALSLENINGKAESLLDYRDRVVLVNNWATWCPPCKAEMPTLVSYYQAHVADGFVIISVEAGESKQEVQKFADQYKMTFPVWVDPNGAALNAFKYPGLPSSYVIDRSGAVRVMWVGEIDRAMLEKYVTPLLQGN